jgi:hypothetical protein
MRSRTMLRRLDRIAPIERAEEPKRNLSVLLPSEFDRLVDLANLMTAGSLSAAELQEAGALLGKCPIKTEGEKCLVPVEIPRALEYYWTWSQGVSGWQPYRFHQLGMVERERFLGLCARYGSEKGISGLKNRMVPLDEWHPDDRAEIKSLLDLADSRNKERRGKICGLPAP